MSKDFKEWFELKPTIQEKVLSRGFHIKPGEVWWCSLGENVGIEIDGKDGTFSRPVLIVRVFNKEHIWVVPLTSSQFGNFRVHLSSFSQGKSVAVISQLRTISSRRLLYCVKNTAVEELASVKKAIINLLE